MKNDFVFKKVFGEEGCEDILKPFLEVILKEKIESVEITRDRELLKNFENEKTGIVDVKASFDDKTKVNIEIQLENGYNMNKRSFFYLSKLYSEGFKKGKNYNALLKTISINILGYNEFLKDHCHSVFRLKDEENSDSYYSDVMEIHFLELRKVSIDQVEEEALLDWLEFIKTDKEEVVKVLSKKNKDIYKATKKLEELSSDEEIRRVAENRAKYLSDLETNQRGAYEDGHKQGLDEGFDKGILLAKQESIKKLLRFIEVSDKEKKMMVEKINTIQDLDKLNTIEDLLIEGEVEALYKLLETVNIFV
jgi:predicted transposase/invertase (TIGR01784 family)